jgi:hypothetical protein
MKNNLFFTILLVAFISLSGNFSVAQEVGHPNNSLTIIGPRPIFSNGAKPNVILDHFDTFSSDILAEWYRETPPLGTSRTNQIVEEIANWASQGISYSEYYGLSGAHSNIQDSLGDEAKSMDLNGNLYAGYSFTSQAYLDYLILAGIKAVDAGVVYFTFDGAAQHLETLSFDPATMSEFSSWLETEYSSQELSSMGINAADVTSFNLADYLKSADGGAYTNSTWGEGSGSVRDNPPTNSEIWEAWSLFVTKVERDFFASWVSEIKGYAAGIGVDIFVGANRASSSGHRNWDLIDIFDFAISETFLDSVGYPYHNYDYLYKTALNFNKRFWSWGFPANTGSLNGTNDPWGNYHATELSRLWLAETLAAGGLYQVPADWKSYFIEEENPVNNGLSRFVEFARQNIDLFNLSRSGEVGVVYNEALVRSDEDDFTNGFKGIMALLSEEQIPHDVIFVGDPALNQRDLGNGSDPLGDSSLIEISNYKALILPNVRMLTDTQVATIEDYVNNGGILIGFGDIATQNENGEDVSDNRSLDDYFENDSDPTASGSGYIISFGAVNIGEAFNNNLATFDQQSALENYNNWTLSSDNLVSLNTLKDNWSSKVDDSFTWDLGLGLPRTVHIHRYKDESDGSLVYHFINRDINMTDDVDNQSFNNTNDSSGSIAIPSGFDSTNVTLTWRTPFEDTQLLSFNENNGRLEFTLPSFDVWGILKVGSLAIAVDEVDETPESMFNSFVSSRPDAINDTGNYTNYRYWKGGNHGEFPGEPFWNIPLVASDDNGVESVKLFYRFSADGETWDQTVEWINEDVSDSPNPSNISLEIFFDPPEGEGIYEFYTEAIDNQSQEEIRNRPENGTWISDFSYGIDSTAPDSPSNIVVRNGSEELENQSNLDPDSLESLTINWSPPDDNLSGHNSGNFYITLDNATNLVAQEPLTENFYEWVPGLEEKELLKNGNSLKITFRNEDFAGNWGDTTELFSLTLDSGGEAAPDAPSGVIVANDGLAKIIVSWTDNSTNETGFRVERKEGANGSWTSIASESANTTRYVDTTVLSDTTYFYRVAATGEGTIISAYLESPEIQSVAEDGGGGGQAFSIWLQLFFTEDELLNPDIVGETADPDGDKLGNRFEFLAKLSPIDNTSALTYDFTSEPGEKVVISPVFDEVLWEVQSSTDLLNWDTVEVESYTVVGNEIQIDLDSFLPNTFFQLILYQHN